MSRSPVASRQSPVAPIGIGVRIGRYRPLATGDWRLFASALLLLIGCGENRREPGISLYSQSYIFRVSSDPMPPRAREPIVYKVVVHDRESRAPVENGEGRIFATSRDGVNIWDSFVLGPELGTYYARMSYITAGDWAVAIQFRRDSTARLERIDWMQDVRAEAPAAP